jgi:hypothetical protein
VPNPVTGNEFTYCGTINPGTDVDQLTFTLPATATKLELAQKTTDGSIKVEGTADGEAFTLGGGTIPFKNGKVYVLKISSSAAKSLDYLITVKITAS